ncbi:uncharacterized protein LOC134177614 [Corticium candelabrum]|uniref:uncharacterized protein LOC134177614 n=1 Tax=Corticium candelabrum TaxID=121492 RepID=UPI002E26438E|nr:uncharacterized protein LOC134177614 [Corticium candelabrum]
MVTFISSTECCGLLKCRPTGLPSSRLFVTSFVRYVCSVIVHSLMEALSRLCDILHATLRVALVTGFVWEHASEYLNLMNQPMAKYTEMMLYPDTSPQRIKTEDGWTALHYACFKGHLSIVEKLLSAGCDKEARNDDGSTPLNFSCSPYSCYDSHLSIVNLLISSGADVSAVDNFTFVEA